MNFNVNKLLDEIIPGGVPPAGGLDSNSEISQRPVNTYRGGPGRNKLPKVEGRAVHSLNYAHDQMIDQVLGNPGISQDEIARRLNYSSTWVSLVMASDNFKMRLEERRKELIDPILIHTIEENFKGLASRSLEILKAKLDKDPDEIADSLVLKTLEITSRAAGYGARSELNVNTQVNMDVHLNDLGMNLVNLLRQKKKDEDMIDIGKEED